MVDIEASYCARCERAVVPPRSICPYCGIKGDAVTHKTLKGEGSVLSYTSLHSPPEGFEPPLLMALIQLEDEAVVLALTEDGFSDVTEIGSTVSISTDEEGRFRYKLA